MLSKTGILFTIAVFYACLSIFLGFDLTGFTRPDSYAYTFYENRTTETSAFAFGKQTVTCQEVADNSWLWRTFHKDAADACRLKTFNVGAVWSMGNLIDNIKELGWINAVVFAPLVFIIGWIAVSSFFPTGSGGA